MRYGEFGMAYLPIEDYGVVGNMHTAALIGRNGSVDWLCLPDFDSPSVFCAILDEKIGGHFSIHPANHDGLGKQFYLPETNILITRFLLSEGVLEIMDYMPVGLDKGAAGFRQLIRRVEVIRGSVPIIVDFCPAFNYARDPHRVKLIDGGALFESERFHLELTTHIPLTVQNECGGVKAQLDMKQGERAVFVLRPLEEAHRGKKVTGENEDDLLKHTVHYWHRWLEQCTYRGRWREMVNRSALTLKMLTYAPTG
ncbi:MAG: glycoside hydrolase family 15 protein, partial [Phycisphaerae bacterium]|nr:glycoside hydrolase family 15 protein [Phycisphaerae bacterium]